MGTVTLNSNRAIVISSKYPDEVIEIHDNVANLQYVSGDNGYEQDVLFSFEEFPSNLVNRGIKSIKLSVYYSFESGWPENYLSLRPLTYVSWYLYPKTWNGMSRWIDNTNVFGKSAHLNYSGSMLNCSVPLTYDITDSVLSEASKAAIRCGVCLSLTQGTSSKPGLIDISSLDARLIVEYTDYDVSFNVNFDPTTRYLNPYVSQTFRWSISCNNIWRRYKDFRQGSAVFHWRQGDSGEYADIPVSGTTNSVTIPAETFQPGTVQAYVSVTDTDGVTKDSTVKTINTEDAITSTINGSPRNGSWQNRERSIPFIGYLSNSFGNRPTGFDIDISYDGENWNHNEIRDYQASSSTQWTVYAPKDTFPSSIIYWRARTYNRDGVAGPWSDTFQFTTRDTTSYAYPVSPIGTIEDADDEIAFTWRTNNSSGTESTGADLQYSYDGNTWVNLGHTDGEKSLVVQGGTIYAGNVQWRVRSYNKDLVAGPWSSPVTFVARAAPRVLEVTTDGKPFTVISWQATDQQTYQVEVDGINYGSIFGTEKTFQLPNYLEDGIHTVKVCVQNEMDIWSKPVELTFTVLNVPGGSLHLSGDFDLDAELFWDDESENSDYLVYRDGKPIGEVAHREFTDRVVLGEHTYYVVNRFANGYYSKSNEVECTLSTDITQIALLSGGEWMPLERSENAQQSQRFTHSRNVAYHHFSGDKNPTPEVSDEEDIVGEFDAAWFYTEEGTKKLTSLLGQALIIKSRGEEVIIGVLEAYTKVNRKHFRGYAFNIHQMEWKDYICAE